MITSQIRKNENGRQHIIRDHLSLNDLLELVEGDALALTVKNFYNKEYCNSIASNIFSNAEGGYRNAPTISKLGMAYFETDNIPSLIDEYYKKAIPSINFIRELCSPFTSPIDLLRLKLDEIWDAGAKIESFHNKKMFVGLCRIVEPGIDFLPHQDVVSRDIPNNFNASSIIKQLAANIYVSTPDQGGELNVWDLELQKEEYDSLRKESYGIERNNFFPPDIVIKPDVGDLFIFNARKLHAVAPSIEKNRIALSTFIGYKGRHCPLTFWS